MDVVNHRTTKPPRPARWRGRKMRRALGTLVIASLLFAGGTITNGNTPLHAQSAQAMPAAAPVGSVNASILRVVAPTWLVKLLKETVGDWAGGDILESMGYTCPIGLPLIACYKSTSYDPPRYAGGTVDTGGSAYYLNARTWPARNAPVVRTFPNGWRLTILCQTTGEWVNGRWGPTNIWNYVGHQGDRPRFVSDGFVYTGSNGFVAGDCANTNYGSG